MLSGVMPVPLSSTSWVGGRSRDLLTGARLRFAYGHGEYFRSATPRRAEDANLAGEFPNLGDLLEDSRRPHDVFSYLAPVFPTKSTYWSVFKSSARATLLGALGIAPMMLDGVSGDVRTFAATAAFASAALLGALSETGRQAGDGAAQEAFRRVSGSASSFVTAGLVAGAIWLYAPSADLASLALAGAGAVAVGSFLNVVPPVLSRGIAALRSYGSARARVPLLQRAFNSYLHLLTDEELNRWFRDHPDDEVAVLDEAHRRLFEEAGRWETVYRNDDASVRQMHDANAALRAANLSEEEYTREYAVLEDRFKSAKARRDDADRVLDAYAAELARLIHEREAAEARAKLKAL